jgi:glycosyltransferase involved in cell wall biosynthesis
VNIAVPIINNDSGSAVYFRDLQRELSRRGITIELKQFSPLFECAPALTKAISWLSAAREKPDIVHSNADYGVAFKVKGKPFITTVHHNVFDDGYQRFTTFPQKVYHFGLLKNRLARALKEADRVVAVSHSTKASLERTFGATNVEVIYNGIDTELFKPKDIQPEDEFAGRIRLLFVGNLIMRKGADLLPTIMKKLGGNYVLFYTAGKRRGKSFTAPNMIRRVVKSRADLVDLYNNADIFLFPSRLEGFGYSVGEAMACGKPVVCTDASSLPELIVDEKGGFLCRLDSVDDFFDKVRLLGRNEQLRRTMGKFNRNRIVRHFNISQMGTSYGKFYRRFS